VIPIGGVILWWGRAVDIPEGFEACDGTIVTTKDAVIKGAKPNLQNKFVRGAEDYRSFVPTEYAGGGSDSLNVKGAIDDHKFKITAAQLPAHTHTLKDHTHAIKEHTHAVTGHTHTIPPHTHSIAAHTHEVDVVYSTATAVTSAGAGDTTATFVTAIAAPGTVTTTFTTGANAGASLTTSPTTLATGKNADGKTAANKDAALKTEPAAVATDSAGTGAEITLSHTGTGILDNKPAYVDLVFLIRVK
jgi:hypothetical protein